jgi:hypothetical protein
MTSHSGAITPEPLVYLSVRRDTSATCSGRGLGPARARLARPDRRLRPDSPGAQWISRRAVLTHHARRLSCGPPIPYQTLFTASTMNALAKKCPSQAVGLTISNRAAICVASSGSMPTASGGSPKNS